MKMITIDQDKCSGCRLCELACSLEHCGEFNPAESRVRVVGYNEPFSTPSLCLQCSKPYCMAVCPSDAITREADTGIVRVSRELCTGCKMCITACPFGSMSYYSKEGVAVKCDTCDDKPECVDICPTGALTFKEAATAMLFKQRALADKFREVHRK
ncbi:MAG: 4Fe-4S dicluster domain-containing protein [Chloroflexi bacterium]|nr:4Fe-4S dicluster domain-containing protein [Chloroflexota bacterium]